MNKLFTLIALSSIGMSFGQVFTSDLSSWTGGDPDGWMGTKTNIASDKVTEQTIGVTYGTSMAQLFNEESGHKRLTTEAVTVVAGETYEIKMWITSVAGAELRTNYYDATNDSFGTYNGYIDIFAETTGVLTMLSQTVTVADDCTSAEFILSIKNTDALVGIVLDSVAIVSTTAPEADVRTIYEIQYSTTDPYISDYEGDLIQTSGIVTGVFASGSSEGRFFMQDGTGAWNGIYVYENGTALALGDSITVTGIISEFYTLTEITSVTGIEIHSSSNPQPAAVEVATGSVTDEMYEGVLVTVVDAKCTNDDAGFGMFEVNDGSGVRLIDDEIFSYTPTVNNYYSITGVTFLSFDEVKIYPRMAGDITVTGYAGIEKNTTALSIFPNPASDMITLTVSADASVVIYNVAGAIVYSANGNVNTIDISGFDAGMYNVAISQNETISTQKLIVR